MSDSTILPGGQRVERTRTGKGVGFGRSVAFSAARGAALIGLAVIIGIVLLQVIDDGTSGPIGDGGSGAAASGGSTSSTAPGTETSSTTTATTASTPVTFSLTPPASDLCSTSFDTTFNASGPAPSVATTSAASSAVRASTVRGTCTP